MTLKTLSIDCPHCHASISLSETITAQASAEAQADLKKQFDARLQSELAKARQAADKAAALELQDLKSQIKESQKQIDDFQKLELEMRRKQRELDEQAKRQALEVERKLDAERQRLEAELTRRISDESKLKLADKDTQLDAMRRQIEVLSRKAEQGSQQMQGEVLELSLEESLKSLFPHDAITPVRKGVNGADIVQEVAGAAKIAWEAKRTKSFKDSWLDKIKSDQRAIGAEYAVIVTQTMPDGHDHCALIDGVWVVDFSTYGVLAVALRQNVVEIVQVRAAATNKGDKMGLMYDYLTGTGFKQRIEAIVETFVAMKDSLEQERRALLKTLSVREQQINRLAASTVGLYGDLRGIVGQSLPQVQLLELPAAEA